MQGFEFPLDSTSINDVLEFPNVPDVEFHDKIREMDLECRRNTLVDITRRDQVNLAYAEGITGTDFSADMKRLLHFVTTRICPSINHTTMTFP